jgi:hypothetical protein
MPGRTCGARTRTGDPCQFEAAKCPHEAHAARRAEARNAGEAEPRAPIDLPGALDDRNLRGMGWWLVRAVLDGQVETARATVVSATLRLLASLGPEPLEEEEALRQVELRGRLMHGRPPRDAEEWALAERTFSAQALEEFRRWELLERDVRYGKEPLLAGDSAAGERHVPFAIEDEDGA